MGTVLREKQIKTWKEKRTSENLRKNEKIEKRNDTKGTNPILYSLFLVLYFNHDDVSDASLRNRGLAGKVTDLPYLFLI